MKGIEHTCIFVSDLEQSIEFYKKLGFKILRKTIAPHAMMYLGNDVLEIVPRLEENRRNGFSPPYPFHLAFYTDNLEEDVRARSSLQVLEYEESEPSNPKLLGCMIPSEDEDQPWKAVRFEDPDGITLEIWQRR